MTVLISLKFGGNNLIIIILIVLLNEKLPMKGRNCTILARILILEWSCKHGSVETNLALTKSCTENVVNYFKQVLITTVEIYNPSDNIN
jgi:hypothetical protein